MRLNQKVTQTVTFLKNLINQNQFKKISHTQPPKKQSIMIKKNKIYLNVEQTLISTRNLKQQKKTIPATTATQTTKSSSIHTYSRPN